MALLELRDFCKAMPRGPGIDEIERIEVVAGEIVGLLGSEYAIMTLRVLAGTNRPDLGTVWFEGKNVTRWSERRRVAQGLVLLSSQPRGSWWLLASGRWRQTVDYAVWWAVAQTTQPSRRREFREDLLERLGLRHIRLTKINRISSGERVRVFLAQCLALDPKILLFEWPPRDLDPKTASELIDMFKEVSREGIGLVVAGAPIEWLLEISDRCYLFKGGRILAEGDPSEVIEKHEAVQLFFGNRYKKRDAATRPRIFLSYRREDSIDTTHHLYEQLAGKFGRNSVLMDLDSIPAGSDYRRYLQDSLMQCEVLIAVIGEHWLNARTEDGTSRLNEESDWVRIEIETALEMDKPVIPLLVARAKMPSVADLPESIRDLAFRQSAELRVGQSYQLHVTALTRRLEELFESRRSPGRK